MPSLTCVRCIALGIKVENSVTSDVAEIPAFLNRDPALTPKVPERDSSGYRCRT